MKPLSRNTLIITAILQFLALGLSQTHGDTRLFETLTPQWFEEFQRIANIVALILIYIGLQVQHFRLYLGLWLVVTGCVLMGVTLNPQLQVGFLTVAYEAWFIGAFVQRHRKAWLCSLIVGSLLVSSLYLFDNALTPVGPDGLSWYETKLQEMQHNPETNWVYIVGFFFGGLLGWLTQTLAPVALWKIGSNRRRAQFEVMDLKAQAELAALRERQRIAREMHDIVAHSLTVVIAQSDGGRYAGAKDPAKAMNALETIGNVSRDALKEMRGLLSVLRVEDNEETSRSTTLQPGLGDLEGLINRGREAGLDISVTRKGEEQPLSQAAQLHIYRIMQECLTNVLKHSGTVPVLMLIDWETPGELLLRVDSGSPEDPKAPQQKPGKGLQGIAERARLMAGSANWGPSLLYPGGWTVEVCVPLVANKAAR